MGEVGERRRSESKRWWEVCMCVCHVWARVRVCENAGVFIYGMCTCEGERESGRERCVWGQGCACVGPQMPVYLRRVSFRVGLQGV